jgi:hypothetical protein
MAGEHGQCAGRREEACAEQQRRAALSVDHTLLASGERRAQAL